MRFIHVSDVHANRDRVEAVNKVFDCIESTIQRNGAELVLFSGDFWDATITNTKASGFTEYVERVHRLKSMAEVMFIYGTPRHEPKGSLDVFSSIGCIVVDSPQRITINLPSGSLDVLAIPEPRKGDYVGLSSDEVNKSIFMSYLELSKHRKEGRPFVVAFHGEVSGSMYQNGVEAKSGAQFPSAMLAGMEADYYALGHIHLPQEVFTNAHYPGSPAPLDFGESHEGAINLVDVGKATVVERIPTNAPTYHTVEVDSSSVSGINPSKYNGNHLRVIVNNGTDKDIPHAISTMLTSKSKLLSCKVVVNRETKTHSRSDEMVTRRTSLEKYEEYCKMTRHKPSIHAKEFLSAIDDAKSLNSVYPSKSFELVSISLRGSIGVKCGTGQDEIFIDFSRFSPGVVAMIGHNGRGKTTIIENCHPYPRMLTRDKVLKEHFYLKDSHRILVYRSNDGKLHKIAISIDASTKSGRTTYMAYESDDGVKWRPCIDTDGHLDTYNEYLQKTFGTIDLFIRTSFFTRKETRGAPDLTIATKGEKIEFFSNLAGNDWLHEIADMARDAIAETKKDIERTSIRLEECNGALHNIDECNDEIAELEDELSSLKEDMSELKSDIRELEKHEARRIEIDLKRANSEELKVQLQENIKTLRENLSQMDEMRKLHLAVQSNMDAIKRIEGFGAIYPQVCDSITEIKDELVVVSGKLDAASQNETTQAKNVSFLRATLEGVRKDMEMHKSQSVECDTHCPLCGSKISLEKSLEIASMANAHMDEAERLLETARGLEPKLALAERELESTEKNASELRRMRDSLEHRLSEAQIRKDEVDNKITEAFNSIRETSGLDPIMVYDNRKVEYNNSEYDDTMKQVESLEARLSEIKDIEPIESRKKELDDKKAEHDILLTQSSSIKGELKSIKQRISRLEKVVEKGKELESELKVLEDKKAAYTHVQTAFSKTGIPLIELESAIPEIASMANDILHQSYGDRFTISFETVRQGTRKAVDDLNVVVYDSQQGMSKYLDMVCSGEEVWIKQALFYAFSIVRMNRTGFSFMTRFIDESDSSLDTASRVKYLGMIEAAHRLAGARLSILITHSQEIKDVAEQVIEI